MAPERNSPCPCGSGRKYKKCCLSNDEASVSPQQPTDAGLHDVLRLYQEQSEWLDRDLSARSAAEVAFDNAVLASLREGTSIRQSLESANTRYPDEALKYDEADLQDIGDHYAFLLNHVEIKEKLAAAAAGHASWESN